MHDQDRVVHDDPHENDETQQREHVQRLGANGVEHCKPSDTPRSCNRDRDHDNERQNEGFEQNRHDEENDDKRNREVDLDRIPGLRQLIGCPGYRQSDASRQALFLQRGDHVCLQQLDGSLQRECIRGANFKSNRSQTLEMADFGWPGGHANLGQFRNRNDTPRRRDYRKTTDILRPQSAQDGRIALKGQIETPIAYVDLGHAQPVVERIHGGGKVLGGQPGIGQSHAIGDQANLRGTKLESGNGPELVPLGTRQELTDYSRRLSCNTQNVFELITGNVDLDGSPAADATSEQGRLRHEPECARFGKNRARQDRYDLGDPASVHRGGPDKTVPRSCHEKEGLERWHPFFGFGGRGSGPHGFGDRLDPLGDGFRCLEIVARRWDDQPENEIAVAFGQIFQLGQEGPGCHSGTRSDNSDHKESGCTEAYREPYISHDEPCERASKMVDPGQGHFLGFTSCQKAARQRRNDGHSHHQRQQDRNRDRHGDVAEKLPCLELHDEDRDEHHHRRQRRNENGPPDLLGSDIGRLAT